LDEFSLIHTLVNGLGQTFGSEEIGPGDDAAVIDSGVSGVSKFLVSSDMLVQDIHFSLCWSTLRDIAWKSLAVNESDIAAMGGAPLGFTISLGFPEHMREVIPELYAGFKDYLYETKLKIYGGDIVSAPVLTIGVTVFGHSPNPVLRSTAKVGDFVYLSREIGRAHAGLRNFKNQLLIPSAIKEIALSAHKRPVSETALGLLLSTYGIAHSMIDISDGLLQDAGHIGKASQVSFLLDATRIPLFSFEGMNLKERMEGLTGGDDYALLFTSALSPEDLLSSYPDVKAYCIGEVIHSLDEYVYFSNVVEPKRELPIAASGYLKDLGIFFGALGYCH
jgi:thiamine-monophosphate kinase